MMFVSDFLRMMFGVKSVIAKRVTAFFPNQLQTFLFFSPLDLTAIVHIPLVKTNLRTPLEVIKAFIGLLPEEDVPEEQPARINQECYEWVDQRAVQRVVQDALRDDGQIEHPTVLEADRHFLQLLEDEDGNQQSEGRAEDDQDEGGQSPVWRRRVFRSELLG